MLNLLFRSYRYLFARQCFVWFHRLIYRLGLSGLGILNYENEKLSGETFFLNHYLKNIDSGVIIDVGANVGNYSKAIIAINPSFEIHAFEPHPNTFKKLIESVASQKFYAVNSAVGDKEGVIALYDYESEDGSSHASLYQGVIEKLHKAPSAECQVKLITLSSYLKKKNIDKIVLLKIDTEGHELAVIRGLVEDIKVGKIQAIHFEFNEMNIISRTYLNDFFEILDGYQFYRLLPNGMMKIKQYNPVDCEIFAYQNIVAILVAHSNLSRKDST